MSKNLGGFELPRPVGKKDEVTVSFDLNSGSNALFEKLVKWEYSEMVRLTRYESSALDWIVDQDDLRWYLENLLKMRVAIAREEARGITRGKVRHLRIPARFSIILANVGQVYVKSHNIKIMPKLEGSEDCEKIDYARMIEISDKLENLLGEGYVSVKGMGLDIRGSFELMSKAIQDDGTLTLEDGTTKTLKSVVGLNVDHPIFGFFAAILGSTAISSLYGDKSGKYYVMYSTMDTYDTSFYDYFRSTINVFPEVKGLTPEKAPIEKVKDDVAEVENLLTIAKTNDLESSESVGEEELV